MIQGEYTTGPQLTAVWDTAGPHTQKAHSLGSVRGSQELEILRKQIEAGMKGGGEGGISRKDISNNLNSSEPDGRVFIL